MCSKKKQFLSSNGYGRRLAKLLKDRVFDAVIIEYIHSSYFLNFLNGEPKVILDVHDIISERAEEFKKFNYAGALYELPAATELEILKVYDQVMVLCQPDQQKLSGLLGEDKVLLCPHPVTVTPHAARDEVKNISFIASAYLPNRDAVNTFIKDCWPAVAKQLPGLTLSIYGTVCSSVEKTGAPNIELRGFVPDLNAIYEEADIMINPVRFGAGMKIKNAEALAHGLPLITTSHGARGLEAAQGSAFLVADTPESFIEAILSLSGNKALRKQLSESALTFIAEEFSVQRCFAPLVSAITAG
ncbi:MAG: glycosyltransferase family 4 protein [Mucilaginibacter sp.]